MRNLTPALVLVSAFASSVAFAQTAGPFISLSANPTAKPALAGDLDRFLATKVDTTNGVLTGVTSTGGAFNGPTITGASIQGVALSGGSVAAAVDNSTVGGNSLTSLFQSLPATAGGVTTFPGPIVASIKPPGATTPLPLPSWLSVSAPADKNVFIGGVGPRYGTLADPVANAQMLASGRIGLYQHANGNAPLTAAQRIALWATWGPTGVTPTGQGQSVGEVGGYTEAQGIASGYLAYFGGAYPNEVNMNIVTGTGDGSGSYTASATDAKPGTVYTGYTTANDLTAMQSAIRAANGAGAKNVAIFMTPNSGGEDLDDPFATSAYWANVRAAALYGGGIAIDTPPSYYLARGTAYQSMIAQMVLWGIAQSIRVSFTVSPYATTADATGNTGGCGYDPAFLEHTMQMVGRLHTSGAMPTQWVVENYGLAGPNCGTANDVQTDTTPESLNAVALYLARTTRTTLPGTALAGSNHLPDAGLMSSGTPVPSLAASLATAHVGPIVLADILGARTMAAQGSDNVQITGGNELNTYIQTAKTPLFLNGIIVQGTGAAVVLSANTPNTLSLQNPTGTPMGLSVGALAATSVSTGTLSISGITTAGVINAGNINSSGNVISAAGGMFAVNGFFLGNTTLGPRITGTTDMGFYTSNAYGFTVGTGTPVTIDATGAHITGNLTVSGTVTSNGSAVGTGGTVTPAAFTPSVQIAGANATLTYTAQVGRAAQTGSKCDFDLQVEYAALAATTGAVTLSGLPSGCTPTAGSPLALSQVSEFGVSTTPLNAVVNSAGAIVLTVAGAGAISSETPLDAAALSPAGGFYISGHVFTGATPASFTPLVQAAGANVSATYGVQAGRVLLTPSKCEFSLQVEYSGLSAAGGAVTLSGLPAGCAPVAGAPLTLLSVSEYGVSSVPLNGTLNSAGQIALTVAGAGSVGAETALNSAALAAAGGFYVSGSVFTK